MKYFGFRSIVMAALSVMIVADWVLAQPNVRKVVVAGQIRQAGTGLPLQGHVGWIEYVPANPETGSSSASRGDGAFTDPDGKYRVEILVRDDFNSGHIVAIADDHISARRRFEVLPGQDHVRLDFELSTQVRVDGQIVTAQGQPVADATVHIVYPGEESSGRDGETGGVVTDRTGHFRLPRVKSSGRFVLEVVKEGFLPAFSPVFDCQGESLENLVVPVLFRKGTAVSGRVLDQAGLPVSGALVWISIKPDPGIPDEISRFSRSRSPASTSVRGGRIQIEADEKGIFEFAGLAPGASFRLTATHRNRKYQPTRLRGLRTGAAGTNDLTVVLKPK